MKFIVKNKAPIATVNDIHDWILDSRAGEMACYYYGELSRSRETSKDKKELNSASDYVWQMMSRGFVRLLQQPGLSVPNSGPNMPRAFLYIMQRTDKRMRLSED